MTIVHTSIHLATQDPAPRAMLGQRDTVWVDLAGQYGGAQVFPASAEQADALAAAFTRAARLMRGDTLLTKHATLSEPGEVPQLTRTDELLPGDAIPGIGKVLMIDTDGTKYALHISGWDQPAIYRGDVTWEDVQRAEGDDRG